MKMDDNIILLFHVAQSVGEANHCIYCIRQSRYRIAENFQGRKLSQISRFCDDSRKFSPRNLGVWHPLALQKRAIRESFLRKNCIFHQSVKVFCYTVHNSWAKHDKKLPLPISPMPALYGNHRERPCNGETPALLLQVQHLNSPPWSMEGSKKDSRTLEWWELLLSVQMFLIELWTHRLLGSLHLFERR